MIKQKLFILAAFMLMLIGGYSVASAQGRTLVTWKEGQIIDQTFTFKLSYIDGTIKADLENEGLLADKMVKSVTFNESAQEVVVQLNYADMGVLETRHWLQSYLDNRYAQRNPSVGGPEDLPTYR